MRIPIEQQIIAIIFSVLLLLMTIQLVRKHRLREQYALIWLAASATVFLLTIFDGLVDLLARIFAVSYAPTLILVFGLLYTLVIALSQSVMLSTQADRIRDLAQSLSMLEWRLRQAERGLEKTRAVATPGAAEPASTPAPQLNGAERAPAASVAKTERPQARRVLVVGLDGATFDLVHPWVAEGRLPTLSRLMREGAHGALRSTVPPMTGPAWTTFATGVNPGKHRIYDWIARDEGRYTFSPLTALDTTAPTLYTLLSEAGRRVCALNIPMTYPPTPVNGVMVSGIPAPSVRAGITYPAGLYQEIVHAVGDYILYPDPGQAYSDSGVDAFLQRLYRTTELRVKTLEHLRGREAWDFAMVVFNGTDTISHALWKYTDASHPLHDKRLAAKYGNAIRDYYEHLDGELGRIVDTLEEDTTLVVMSDHGFGPFHKFIHVNNWLMREGFMRTAPGVRAGVKRALFQAGMSPMNVYDKLMRIGLGALKREVVRGQGQGLLKTLFLSFDDIDWQRTQAYSLGNVGQIYLNVAGREPQGCVQPGAEYEQVRDQIIARLMELRDPQNGEMVVETVYRREELFSGDQFGHAPDIVFLPRRLEYFGFGEYEFGSHRIIEPMQRGISGTHRMNGIFLAYGASVKPGATVRDASLVDLAPTILALMGETIPAHIDGRVLTEALIDLDERPQRTGSDGGSNGSSGPAAKAASQGDKQEMSAEERRMLAERLRSLGYVG